MMKVMLEMGGQLMNEMDLERPSRDLLKVSLPLLMLNELCVGSFVL